ncbi:MAG: hypothetical protein H6621_06135 [Halobacteriovoraceae bacterium]|nr:hypothetical protein [Halobacteriovoraceae bacterium]
MKKTLFISLKTSQELILIKNIILHWKKENPNYELHLLTWEKNKSIEMCGDLDITTHYIDKEKIKKIKRSQLIPDFHAVNTLWGNLGSIFNTRWDTVINTSNDNISSILSSVLNFEHYHGVHYSKDKVIKYSNKWAKYLNEVYPYNPIAINKFELLMSLLNLPYQTPTPWEARGKYFDNAKTSLNEIKSINKPKKMISIDISAFTANSFNIDEISWELFNNDRYFPVFIHNIGDVPELEVLEKIQQKINEELYIIETDLEALSAVVANSTIIITGDTVIKQIAHCYQVPTITLRANKNYHDSTGYSYVKDDIIIQYDESSIIFEELLACIDIRLEGKPRSSVKWLFNDIYQIKVDSHGSFRLHINPTDNNLKNLGNYSIRTYHTWTNQEASKIIDNEIYNLFSREEIAHFSSCERSLMNNNSKNLLVTIKTLKEALHNEKKIREFLVHLNNLFIQGDPIFITTSINLLFQSSLEDLNDHSQETLLSNIEMKLFNLREEYQKLSTFLNSLAPKTKQAPRISV